MGNIISSNISGICGGIINGVDYCASAPQAKEVEQVPKSTKIVQLKDEQLLSPTKTVGTSDVVSDSSDVEDDDTSSFIGDISFDSLPLHEEPQEKSQVICFAYYLLSCSCPDHF